MNENEERVRMGIDGLDEMLSGGLIPGSFAAIVGTYGTGKTTFALQFIWEGLVRGETAIYISLEEGEEAIFKYMQVKGWDIDQYRNTSLFVLKLDPTNFNLSINSIRNDLPPLIKKYNAKRVVFDPISLFEDLFDTDSARRHELFRFVDMLRSEDCTVLMTSEADQNNQYSSRHNLIEYLVDTVILLRYIRSNESSQVHLALEVVKMRLSAHSREIKPYEILSDRVNVYSEANVF